MSNRDEDERRPVRFSFHMIESVRRAALAGVASNADIARVLRRRDHRIGVSHVVKWREAYVTFNQACEDALDEQLEEIANVGAEAALDGDTIMIKYMLDRLHPAFMPKSKNETTHKGEGLDEMLKRRALSDDDLRASGVIQDVEREDE